MEVKPEVRQLCDEIRRFIRNEVDPRSRWIEENDEIPADLLQKARELGLFGLTIPEEYGGIGLDLAGKCAVEEEMGKTNYGFATVIGNHTGISSTAVTPSCWRYGIFSISAAKVPRLLSSTPELG